MVAVEVASSHAVVSCAPTAKHQLVAVDHLLEGKRHLLVEDYPNAASSLAQACQFLSAKHGETANECADAYFHYGKVLLELGRMEAGVLGNALKGVPDEDDEEAEKITEDEKEEIGSKVWEALEENFETHEEKINNLLCGHTKLDCDEDEEDMEDEEASQDEAMETEKPSEEKHILEEDPSNLERAWEMLELAKNIYSRMAGIPTNIRKLTDTLLALGEVSIENENYSQAVEDFTSCLEKRKDKLPNDMREIAETQYQLGVALSYHSQYDEAVKYFEEAVKVLTTMHETLKADTFSARVSEIDELERLIPEIREKIQDTIACKEETSQAKKMKSDSGFSSSDKPVRKISPKKK